MSEARGNGAPLKVAHVVLSLDVGGMENGIVNVANRIAERGIETHILCIRRRGSLAERLDAPTRLYSLDLGPGFSPLGVKTIADYLRRQRIELLFTHNRSSLVWGGLARLLAPGPRHLHGEHGNLRNVDCRSRWLARRVHRFMAVSDNLVDELRSGYALPDAEVEVIVNGVDTERFSPDAGDGRLRSELGLPEESVLAIMPARLEPRKNQALAIAALGMAANANDDVKRHLHLLFAGEGPDRAALADQAAGAGIADNVHFLGYRTDMPNLLAQCQALVFTPAWGEGMPNAILEGAACGLPALASRISGNDRVVDHRRTGLLLPVDEPTAWAAALRDLIDKPKNFREWGKASRLLAESRFSLISMIDAYANLFRRTALKPI